MSCRLGIVFAALLLAGCTTVHWGQERACAVPVAPAPMLSAGERSRHDLQIVSWNVHGTPYNGPMQARILRIAAQLEQRRPDVILLQEVWFEGDARLLEAALRKHYEPVADDPAVGRGLLNLLTGLRSGGLLAFVRKGSGWLPSARRSSFSAYQAQGPVWRLFEGDGIGLKGVQKLELQKQGTEIAIFHTHLQAQYGENRRYTEERSMQLLELERIVQLSAARISLAVGDFNTAPSGRDLALYASMLESWDDLTSSLRSKCDCDGTHLRAVDGSPYAMEAAWVDYALARRAAPVQVVHSELVRSSGIDCPFSDHHGIELHLALSR
jgi:endonuclease/exonuclease/phosphatase family metal-dependent hydrolase